jgi:hypothetical protein
MKYFTKMGLVGLALTLALFGADVVAAQEGSHENVGNPTETRFWGSAEYLYWFREERKIPPLVTTSAPGTPTENAGVLGEPTTRILIGNEDIGDNGSNGGRATFGIWFDNESRIGVGASFFRLEEENIHFSQRGDASGTPTLAIPFYDVSMGQEAALFVNYSGLLGSGTINVDTTNDIYGGDLFLRWNFTRRENWRWDVLVGYSFSRIEDDLSLSARSVAVASGQPVPVGTTFNTEDKFEIKNDFHCLSLGLMGEYNKKPWGISGLARVRVGNVHQEAKIQGSTSITVPNSGSVTSAGGLFAQPTNSGTHSQDEFAFIPEAQLNLKYQLSKNLGLSLGYNVIWWNSVALAGEQMDRAVNTTQLSPGTLVGPARPSFSFHENGFLVHGFSAGLDFEF